MVGNEYILSRGPTQRLSHYFGEHMQITAHPAEYAGCIEIVAATQLHGSTVEVVVKETRLSPFSSKPTQTPQCVPYSSLILSQFHIISHT